MSQNTYTRKIKINNNTYFLKLQWKQNDFELFSLQILCKEGNGWSGSFSSDLAQKQIEKLHQTEDGYYGNTKKCLIGEDSDYKLDLSISDDEETATFSWKKRYEDFFQTQGALTLIKDTSMSECALIDFLIDENKELKTTITEMNQQSEEINAELVKYKSELEKFVDIKTSLEASLYGKFVQLLNTKKQRIKSLEEQLQKYAN